ncbi:MAG: hypothetical protein V4631_00640 [Pseudomonadota bacterium]
MFQYRQTLVRLRLGDSDREIAPSRTTGRKKVAQIREIANARGWLAPDAALPNDATLTAALTTPLAYRLPTSCKCPLSIFCGTSLILRKSAHSELRLFSR